MRDTIQKRTYSEFEEASYTKQKRLMAVKAVAEMKRKLEDASQTAADSGTNLERRVEREAAEERRREDRTEARQHIQDMLMMLAALQNGTMPGVRM
ncbi:hypothetical protein JG687_00004537 [Phytophthora cactorum]|uniref:Uncharacterized protein n=1 Tax=Phytophthora cactorum TaxID=29920 RepID=A0A8T1UND6_9STRA|nr:hypothetical protein JG687_00004537 [Phytophthora cactorum]